MPGEFAWEGILTTLYEKVGRRYVPVRDTEAYNGLGRGSWLVIVDRGVTSVRRLVHPDHAGFLAAARVAEDAMLEALRRASEARPRQERLNARERRAFEAWKAIMGEEILWLQRESAQAIVDAGIEAVKAEWGRAEVARRADAAKGATS